LLPLFNTVNDMPVFDESARPDFRSHMIGTKLAHYEMTSHIGSGGMGDVYQATDTKLGSAEKNFGAGAARRDILWRDLCASFICLLFSNAHSFPFHSV